MAVASRSIPIQSSKTIRIVPANKSAQYARHWLELLGCIIGDDTAESGIVITGGDGDFPGARCVIRLWDYQVGRAGSGTMASAISGAAAVIGHPGRPGVPLPADMPEKWCGAYGAILALAELWRRRGADASKQIVYDVSAADVLRSFSLQNSGDAAERSRIWRRNGRLCVDHGGIFPMGFFACKDGHVAILGRSRRDWRQIRKAIGDPEWAKGEAFEDPFKLAYDSAEADALLERTLSGYSRDELLRRGLAEGAVIAPVYSESEARERDIFRGGFVAKGSPAMPFTVQHLGEEPDRQTVRPPVTGSPDTPLAGLRCIELCWVWSGPMVGQILADLGAEIVKVEAPKRFDLYRTRGLETKRGEMDERTRIESSVYFHSLNRNKIGLALDLKQQKGLGLAKKLAGVSDLLIENFTVGTMERLGLGGEALSDANPNLVQLSMSGPGRGSAVQDLRSYGLVLSALGGAEALIEKDGEFLGSPTFSISDPNAALFGALAALAGVLAVEEGDAGRQIDLSQIEAAATLIGVPSVPQNTRDAILATSDGKFIAVSVPCEAFADDAALRRAFESMTYEDAVRRCRELGGHAAGLLELDDTDEAMEFAECSGWSPSTHPCTGDELLVAAPWRIDGQRPSIRKHAPLLGEGDDFVLRHILSLNDEEIGGLKAAHVVGMPEWDEESDVKMGKAKS
jgi:crotonobetainyl-CoA:carnitine CoA-transferase CaiB-like acyl-CoA transferase